MKKNITHAKESVLCIWRNSRVVAGTIIINGAKPSGLVQACFKRLTQALLPGMIGVALLAGQRANAMYDPSTYNATDPAYPVTYTATQKAAQRTAGTNMMNALIAAANSGATNYTIAPGTYRINGGYYTLNGLQNFTINCSNVEMWLVADTNKNSLNWIHINNCQNVSLLGPITFDSDNRLYCQATVTGWNATNGTINLQIMPGYNPTNFWDISHPDNANSGGMSWHYNTNGLCLTKPNILTSTNYNPGDITQVQINVGTSYFSSGPGNLLHVGDLLLSRCWYCSERDPVILQNNNQKIVLSGLQCYDGGMWVIGGASTLLMTNCSTFREPGGNELGGAEEIWDFFANNVVFDSCNNGPAWDDGIDCQGKIGDQHVIGMLSSNVVVLRDSPPVGTLLTFFQGENWMPEGQAKVALAPSRITATGTLQFSNLLAVYNIEYLWWPNGGAPTTTNTTFYAVTLDRAMNIPPYSIEQRSDGYAQSAVVNNCYFSDMNAAEILMDGYKSLVITSNLFERGSTAAIWSQISRFWMGGPATGNETIAYNTFNSCPSTYGGANNYADTVLVGEDSICSPSQMVCSNINIVGNVFSNSAANDVTVINCYNVNIISNTSISCQPPQSSGAVKYNTVVNASIFVAACSNVFIQGNQLLNPTLYCTNVVEIGPFVSAFSGSDVATAEFSTNALWYETGWDPTNQFVTYNITSPLQCAQASYAFNGNTLDSSGNGRNGSAIANYNNGTSLTYPNYVAGKAAGTQAISLNGGSVNIPCSVGVTNFSIAVWVKTTDNATENLCFGDIPGYTYDFGVALNGSKFALFIGNPAVSGDTWLFSSKTVNDGNWHHCVAEWNCGTGAMSVYVDGTFSGTLAGPAGIRWATLGFQRVGYGVADQPLNTSMKNGAVANLQLYNYLLSTTEISRLYNLQPPLAPATPTNLTATAGDAQVSLNWNPPPGATGFNLYRSLTSGGSYTVIATNLSSISYTDTGLANGTTYYYEIAATNSGGASTNSTPVNATPQAIAVPAVPTGLVATAVGTNQISLGWMDNSGGAASFQIQRSYDGVNFYVVGSVGTNITNFTDAGLLTGATYYYEVLAVGGAALSPASAILTVTTLPLPPTGLSALAGSGEVDLSWTASFGAAAYNVNRSTTNGGPYTAVASGLTGTSYIDDAVTNGVTCYYVLTATADNAISVSSGQVSATPAPVAPVAYYAFSGNVLDTSGSGNNGVNSGATFVAGQAGQGASFNGSSAYVTIPKSIGVAGSGFTIAFWIKTTDKGGSPNWYQGHGLVDGEQGGVTTDFGTALVGSKFALGIGQPDTTLTSVKSISDGNWHHVAGTWNLNSGAMQIYVDGILDNSGTGPTGARTAPPNLILGKTPNAAQFFNGVLDEVRLYTNVLTPAGIALLAGLPPNAPTGLTAVAGVGQVTLSWGPVPGVTGYNLKRGLVSGGPYTNIVTATASLNYTNTSLTNGQTYFYVVTALNANGEGALSTEASAMPHAPPTLGITQSGGALNLSWPGWAGTFSIYEATNLTPPALWLPVTNAVSNSNSNGMFNVNLPISFGEEFFRLSSP